MKKRTLRWLGGFAIVVGAVGAVGAFVRKRKVGAAQPKRQKKAGDVWARPGMIVTFRAELMPGRDREDRSFRVKELLASGRVSLHGADGEHTEKEFEAVS
jgi:hypothetical protein